MAIGCGSEPGRVADGASPWRAHVVCLDLPILGLANAWRCAVEKLLTVNEVAAKLQVKVPTLYTWTRQNKIEHFRIGRLIRFDSEQVERFLARTSRVALPGAERRGHEDEQEGKDRQLCLS